MPLSTDSVGVAGAPVAARVDARWTMAYAAALGDSSPRFTDTLRRPDVLAHPLFPVCFEWPVFLGVAELACNASLTAAERVRGVHITHDLVLHRPVRAGQELRSCARVVAIERHRSGAYQVVRLDTTDVDEKPVCTTWYGSLYRGVEVIGDDRRCEGVPNPPLRSQASVRRSIEVPVAANTAHVYSECARIWNPIHTDAAVAKRAGLPGIILHGTATLGLAVSAVVGAEWNGAFERVGRVASRFGAMVAMPSTLEVRILDTRVESEIRFEVRNDRGEPAIREGLIAASG